MPVREGPDDDSACVKTPEDIRKSDYRRYILMIGLHQAKDGSHGHSDNSRRNNVSLRRNDAQAMRSPTVEPCPDPPSAPHQCDTTP